MVRTTFLTEAEKLARPCLVYDLHAKGAPTAYWHGVGPGLCVSLHLGQHWLNVVLSDDCVGGNVEVSANPTESETPLFEQPGKSLPPVDAVFFLGSDAIRDYLQHHNWPRDEPFNANFPDPIPEDYEKKEWQNNCPVYQRDIALVSGGWHMPWPDGDWYDLVDAELVAWTFLEAEPWVEVFKQGGEYIVKQRVT